MLKIIYTDTGLHLELLTVDQKQWIAERLKFAQSIGEPMQVSRQIMTFPVPSPLCPATEIDADLRNLGANTVTVHRCDRDYVEVELNGYWLSNYPDSAEGISICQQTERVESYIWQLWHAE
jgi:hypothetical protein